MIDQSTFELIKKKHGRYASWALWADGPTRPKENVGDLTIFDIKENDGLLKRLNPRVVLVGLNISRPLSVRWSNFHDGRACSMDYKIRYALKGTALWGAYMTDIIKDFEQKASGKMMAYLRKNKSFEDENVKLFEAELRDLGVKQPTLIAFGTDAFEILSRHFHNVWKVPHYSNYRSKEDYREEIAHVIKSINKQGSDTAMREP